jgi:UDP-N-acetylmuramyl tripeptide synthase
MNEPTVLELLLWNRKNLTGFGEIGPLTRDQTDAEQSFEAYMEECSREHEAQLAAGGRMICPKCGERAMRDRTVCTYGYPGHPGADYSALYECDNCDYKDMA